MRTLIIVPAFNEEKNIPQLVENICLLGYDYLVINDCSTDNSKALFEKLKLNHLNLSINLGLASVTQVGFMYAVEHNYDSVVVVDGDGQHPPKYIKTLLMKLDEGYDYVIGSRFLNNKKPWSFRMIGSRMLSFFIWIKTKRKCTDPTSGMRAIGTKVFASFADDFNFVAEPDALVSILKHKYKVAEVQVDMEDRVDGESYFVNPFKSIKFMANAIISILFMY